MRARLRPLASLALLALAAGAGPARAKPLHRPRSVGGLKLPLVEVPARAPAASALVVLLSGDGGWSVADQGLAAELSRQGFPILGWNALRYFVRNRQPERVAGDLDRVLRYGLARFGQERVILIGYSFGADVMPFLVRRLPEDLARRVALLALLGPSAQADFRVHFFDWLKHPSPRRGRPVLPELEKLRGVPILCLYGEAEARDTLCRQLPPDLGRAAVRPGRHIIGKNFAPVAREILEEARRLGLARGGG